MEPYQCAGGQQSKKTGIEIPIWPGGRNIKKNEIEILVRQEGNDAYKSFMRQELFNHPTVTGRNAYNSRFQMDHSSEPAGNSYKHSNIAMNLKEIFGSPADDTSLLSTFSNLKHAINESLDRDISEEYVLVTYPAYLPDSTRDQLRNQLDAAGFHILFQMRRQSLLAPAFADLRNSCNLDNHVLVIELNGAVLEMALIEEYCQAVTAMAYEATLDLGEDVFTLKTIDSRFNETRLHHLNTTALALAKSKLNTVDWFSYLKSSNPNHSLAFLSNLREERFQAIQQAVERFMINTMIIGTPTGTEVRRVLLRSCFQATLPEPTLPW